MQSLNLFSMFDCSDQWKLHEGALEKGALEHCADESWIASMRTRSLRSSSQ